MAMEEEEGGLDLGDGGCPVAARQRRPGLGVVRLSPSRGPLFALQSIARGASINQRRYSKLGVNSFPWRWRLRVVGVFLGVVEGKTSGYGAPRRGSRAPRGHEVARAAAAAAAASSLRSTYTVCQFRPNGSQPPLHFFDRNSQVDHRHKNRTEPLARIHHKNPPRLALPALRIPILHNPSASLLRGRRTRRHHKTGREKTERRAQLSGRSRRARRRALQPRKLLCLVRSGHSSTTMAVFGANSSLPSIPEAACSAARSAAVVAVSKAGAAAASSSSLAPMLQAAARQACAAAPLAVAGAVAVLWVAAPSVFYAPCPILSVLLQS